MEPSVLFVCLSSAWARPRLKPTICLPECTAAATHDEMDNAIGTRWAVLVAGSSGYYNNRHQIRDMVRQSSGAPAPRG